MSKNNRKLSDTNLQLLGEVARRVTDERLGNDEPIKLGY
jgi:hypothetical protein